MTKWCHETSNTNDCLNVLLITQGKITFTVVICLTVFFNHYMKDHNDVWQQIQCLMNHTHIMSKERFDYRNRNLGISTVLTKVKLREPTYSQALTDDHVIDVSTQRSLRSKQTLAGKRVTVIFIITCNCLPVPTELSPAAGWEITVGGFSATVIRKISAIYRNTEFFCSNFSAANGGDLSVDVCIYRSLIDWLPG